MRFLVHLVALALVLIGPFAGVRLAQGHVSAAVRDNNRYIKLLVFGDHVRLAYIIYFGEIPGQKLRRAMDRNGDGTISESEGQAFAHSWAERVASATVLRSGDRPLELRWESTDLGIDDRSASGGAFTLDLVAWLCVDPSDAYVELRDSLELPRPGETEVVPEESPGTEITRIALGGRTDQPLTFNGAENPLRDGLLLRWSAEDQTVSKRCRDRTSAGSSRQRSWGLILGAGGALLIALLGIAVVRRRKTH